jgi:5,5'-dehydrodivanillate O-demethylase
MLSREDNERLTRVGRGTPMGELLRRYWHPVAATSEFGGPFPLKRRLLGDDLIVYRDPSGHYGAIEPRCPHRGASLEFACIEKGGVRCAYHGWKYDRTGQCVDQPVEAGGGKSGVKIQAYPAAEFGGLVWLYLGPQPEPLIPRYDIFVWNDCLREIGQVTLPCNFLHMMENSVDPHHVEWLHGKYAAYVRRDAEVALYAKHSEKIGFDTFEYGIIKRRLVEGQTEESDSWKIGHPLVFPTMLRVGGGGHYQMQIRVPIDDYTTHHYYYTAYRPLTSKTVPEQHRIPLYDIPLRGADGSYNLDVPEIQDMVMWISQGPIADRTKERLSRSDIGLHHLRKLYFSEMDKVQQGLDPMCVIRDPANNEVIDLPQERHTYGSGSAFLRTLLVAGQCRFSPMLPEVLDLFGLSSLTQKQRITS